MGYRYNKELDQWFVISDQMNFWHIDNSGTRKTYKKRTGYLPARSYNYQFALKRFAGDIKKALIFVKTHLLEDDQEKSPVYLHDYLSSKAGKDLADFHPAYSYSNIIK